MTNSFPFTKFLEKNLKTILQTNFKFKNSYFVLLQLFIIYILDAKETI